METGRILGGRYRVEGRIGSGGMSTVYKAHEIELDREVAVKVLISSLAEDSQLVERFNREAKTIASLQHNSIIPIYYYGIEDDFGSYLIMPMLKGGTLEQRLHQLEMLPSLTEVGELAERLGSALQYAHDRGVVHRDIKFSNIMFDDAGSPYLMDFGIAKLLNTTNLTGTGMTVGTPNFMPPEQWRNDDITPAVDQYAFSVLLFAMLTRRMPFEAETAPALMYQHLQEDPPPASDFRDDVPQAIEDALAKALSKNPNERFGSISEFTKIISQSALASTREYSGFFKAPVEDSTQPKRTPIGLPQKNVMPNTPTKMVAEQKFDGAKTTLAHEDSLKNSSEEGAAEPESSNRAAFYGGMLAVLLVGAVIIGGLFIRNQSIVTGQETETAVFIAEATETVIAVQAAAIAATETSQSQPTATLEATDTPEPSETNTEIATVTASATETNTLTASPTETSTATETASATSTNTATATETPTATHTATADATGTQFMLDLTATSAQQATDNAILRLTATEISIFQTQRAEDEATSTQLANNLNATSTENAELEATATAQSEEIMTEQANFDATNTAIALQGTVEAANVASTELANDRNNTATAFAVIQAEFDATATQLAILASEPEAIPIEYGESITGFAVGESELRWEFEASSGDVISLVGRSPDFDVSIELYHDNNLIASNEDDGYQDNARISNLTIVQNGDYTLVLQDQSGDDLLGEYVVGITNMATCPSELAPSMLVGDFGRVVLEGVRNRMRLNPSTQASEVTFIANGDVFEVIEGPVCSDGFTWYRVDYDGTVGWTAEADDEEYWLELLPEDDEPILLAGGRGLTDNRQLPPGEFQVESFCSRRGLRPSTNEVDWFCVNADDVIVITLIEDDFDQICQDTYSEEEAFARQDGDADEPAFRWLCYYVPE